MYILIIVAFWGTAGVAVHSVDFSSKEGCMEAKEKLKQIDQPYLQMACVKDIE